MTGSKRLKPINARGWSVIDHVDYADGASLIKRIDPSGRKITSKANCNAALNESAANTNITTTLEISSFAF